MADLKTMAAKWLKADGYDGLCNPGLECGCTTDDLMPCGEPGCDCEPAYAAKDGLDFMMFLTKSEVADFEEALADGAEDVSP